MNVKFICHGSGKTLEGEFVWEDSQNKLFNQFYSASDIYESGDYKKAISRYKYLLKKSPEFFPAITDLAFHYLSTDKILKAKENFIRSLEIANSIIPNDFNGKIIWGILDNRHYLRTLHGLGLAYAYTLDYDNAVDCFRKILKFNPNDNQGVRYLVGDLYLMAGNNKLANKFLKENLEHASSKYSYGLLLYKTDSFMDAIIQCSLAIFENEFIYMLLVYGKIENSISSYERYSAMEAYEYFRFTFVTWYKNNAVNFLKNIFSTSLFTLYYNEINSIRVKIRKIKGVSAEHISARSRLMRMYDDLIKTIDKDFALKVYNEILAKQ